MSNTRLRSRLSPQKIVPRVRALRRGYAGGYAEGSYAESGVEAQAQVPLPVPAPVPIGDTGTDTGGRVPVPAPALETSDCPRRPASVRNWCVLLYALSLPSTYLGVS